MLYPNKIHELILTLTENRQFKDKYTKIFNHLKHELNKINENKSYTDLDKINAILALLEGLYRHLHKQPDKMLRNETQYLLIALYSPLNQNQFLAEKKNFYPDNLIQKRHDEFYINNSAAILNHFMDFEKITRLNLFNKLIRHSKFDYVSGENRGLPSDMKTDYEQMFAAISPETHPSA